MAEDKGVPVVRLDCSEVRVYAHWDFDEMAGLEELMTALAPGGDGAGR